MYPNIPLVVPEINMDAVTTATNPIRNPNCATSRLAVALYPLHEAAGLRRVVVSTFQSASGHSGAGMDRLKTELSEVLSTGTLKEDPTIFARPLAFNVIPHIDRFEKSGYTKEEMKLVHETRKIFGSPDLLITATTVRVPVLIGHSECINAEFFEPMRASKAVEILSDPSLSPGVTCVDGITDDKQSLEIRRDLFERRYPVPADLEKDEWKDAVLVGRVRDDETAPNAINMWCVSNNLRKGASTNAVKNKKKMLERGLL
jgi:aspartate-semialdehyde dehydrogenase